MVRLASLFLVLCALVSASSAIAIDPTTAYEGQRLYVSPCQLCYGPDGKGGGPIVSGRDRHNILIEAMVSYIRLLSQ